MKDIYYLIIIGGLIASFATYILLTRDSASTMETVRTIPLDTPVEKEESVPKEEEAIVVEEKILPSTGAEEIPIDIVVLNLSHNGLTEVPENTFSKTDTQILDLSYNKLTGTLPAEIRLLKNLTSLDLSHNSFTGVPAEIGQLTYLKTLDLSSNPITGLPYEIGNLKNLMELDLRDTQYSKQDLEIIKKSLPSDVLIKI